MGREENGIMKGICSALLIAVLLMSCGACAWAEEQWSREVYDPCGDSLYPSYDITYAKAWHDGTTFHVTIRLDAQHSTGPYTAYGARIHVPGKVYGLAFMTCYPYYGPQLGVSYDNGANWGFAGGSPSGTISATEINLSLPMSSIGARPWKVDFIAGVWWWFNSYEIRDSTSDLTVPPLLAPHNIQAHQRRDGSHKVDVYYDLWSPSNPTVGISMMVSDDGGTTYSITPRTASLDIGPSVRPGLRRHIIWDAGKDLPNAVGANYKIKLTATTGTSVGTPDSKEESK